ncbi:MAG: serine--tRNA ligase, partial [Candidatus Levyibacteriota bacterium]
MLDIKFIRENPSIVQKAAKDKNVDINVDHILKIDATHHDIQVVLQKLQEERNAFNKEIKG